MQIITYQQSKILFPSEERFLPKEKPQTQSTS